MICLRSLIRVKLSLPKAYLYRSALIEVEWHLYKMSQSSVIFLHCLYEILLSMHLYEILRKIDISQRSLISPQPVLSIRGEYILCWSSVWQYCPLPQSYILEAVIGIIILLVAISDIILSFNFLPGFQGMSTVMFVHGSTQLQAPLTVGSWCWNS